MYVGRGIVCLCGGRGGGERGHVCVCGGGGSFFLVGGGGLEAVENVCVCMGDGEVRVRSYLAGEGRGVCLCTRGGGGVCM